MIYLLSVESYSISSKSILSIMGDKESTTFKFSTYCFTCAKLAKGIAF